MSEPILGLGASPDPVFLFVGESTDEQGVVYPWHMFDHDAKKQIPVKDRALTGVVNALRLSIKTFKEKENVKLDISMMADKPYIIRTGIDTVFARGVLLGLEAIDNFVAPVTVVVANGGEKVVFGRIHDHTGQRVKVAWDKERKLLPLVQALQKRLGQQPQSWADVQATKQPDAPYDEAPPPSAPPEDDDDLVPF